MEHYSFIKTVFQVVASENHPNKAAQTQRAVSKSKMSDELLQLKVAIVYGLCKNVLVLQTLKYLERPYTWITIKHIFIIKLITGSHNNDKSQQIHPAKLPRAIKECLPSFAQAQAQSQWRVVLPLPLAHRGVRCSTMCRRHLDGFDRIQQF